MCGLPRVGRREGGHSHTHSQGRGSKHFWASRAIALSTSELVLNDLDVVFNDFGLVLIGLGDSDVVLNEFGMGLIGFG